MLELERPAETVAATVEEAAEEKTEVASGGLAPARCPGLIMSLRTSRLAALGAGRGDAKRATTELKSAEARVALRVAQCHGRIHDERWTCPTRSRLSGGRAAPRTLTPGGVAGRRGTTGCRTRRQPPRYAQIGAYEAAYEATRSAYEGVETTARCVRALDQDYHLIHATARLAPSFGRTRGWLRGAAGSEIEWPACRTRASLVEAERAEEAARCAWRASERSLGVMECEHGLLEFHVRRVQEGLSRLRRLRARDAAALQGWAGRKQEQVRARVVAAVRWMAAASAAALAQATEMLDRFRWGVWGSARRCKASARELDVLTAALWAAEWGAGDLDLPGGSTWQEAFGALAEATSAQMGGSGVAVGDVAANDEGSGVAADDVGGCGMHDTATADGRQAAGGDCSAGEWRSRVGGVPWGRWLEPTTGSRVEAWRCWEAAWLEAMGEQQRRQGQREGVVVGAATWGVMPERQRLWLALKRRRRRRLEGSWTWRGV
jgi:hypothetical protein